MKKIFLLLIAILLIFSQLSLSTLSAYANSDSEDDYDIEIIDLNDGSKAVAIKEYKGDSTNIIIPSEIKGKPVVEIRDYAFLDKKLTSVEIPSSVRAIGEAAFAKNQLTSIKIPSTITTFGAFVFAANQLTSVEISSNVTVIGEAMFYKNQLTSIDIPSSVTTIKDSAFYDNQLTSVKIPSSVTTIESDAFYNNQLTSIEIPSGVTTIGSNAFSMNHLRSVEISSSVIELGDSVFSFNKLQFVIFHGKVEQTDSDIGPIGVQFEEGKTFQGWFEEQDYTTEWNESLSDPITIYAKWSHYTVTFDSNGGSVVVPQAVEYEKLVKVPSNPEKEGYLFLSWHKDEELTEPWNFEQDIVKKDITLYAKWKKLNYNFVTFDSNGGSEISAKKVYEGKLLQAPATPVKGGYSFTGWYKDKELTTSWDFKKDIVTKNLTLYAKWAKNITPEGGTGGTGGSGGSSPNYNVTFDSNGGSTVSSQTVAYKKLLQAPSSPEKEGFIFAGWYRDKELTTAWDFAKDEVTSNTILYAKWTKDNYIVTFNTNGGSKVSSQTVGYKELVKTPSISVTEGYTFAGWYNDKELTKAWNFAKDVVTENLTLYARWVKDSNGCNITIKDIDNNWAKDMIEQIANQCIIKGYPDGTFRPDDMIQRQHAVLIIDRTLPLTPIREALPFLDVPHNHPYYEQIALLQQAGIVDGSKGAFHPNTYITRAQMAKMLVLAFGLTPEGSSTFKDVKPTHWASSYISALEDHNIALGDKEGNFRPDENLTRAQFSAFMYRALGL
ncbi:InlB B-repeat-containing protein [Lysinibacillus sp. NPDC093688]|uniref:InlB B-repeat-containing protein n=1 Tax=Lysinibacillus sp. NPDC093688 TaxID=3390577 RepID=UPI003D019E6F